MLNEALVRVEVLNWLDLAIDNAWPQVLDISNVALRNTLVVCFSALNKIEEHGAVFVFVNEFSSRHSIVNNDIAKLTALFGEAKCLARLIIEIVNRQ